MKLLILKLKEIIFEGYISFINLPGYNGYFHILNNHGNLFAILIQGYIRFDIVKYINGKIIKNNNLTKMLEITSGLVEVKKNFITILID